MARAGARVRQGPRDDLRYADVVANYGSYESMERAMLGAKLKWQWARYIVQRTDGRWSSRVLEWRPRTGRCSVGRPPTKWTDDLVKIAGIRWMRAAQHRSSWISFGVFV
ncbi:unnamed protein product [Leptidea sinapis]|uniref:Uncharacterized protein n=1 Tax=Leptidea sinapis TaxID=189913 RepID=A0A5E4R4T9_9NEOP|nr:unnamed protein product [Leptidea sinapis]